METLKLPSAVQFGDKVSIRLRPDFVINEAEVVGVHFYEGKVKYDLLVRFHELDREGPIPISRADYTRINNVDSAILTRLG